MCKIIMKVGDRTYVRAKARKVSVNTMSDTGLPGHLYCPSIEGIPLEDCVSCDLDKGVAIIYVRDSKGNHLMDTVKGLVTAEVRGNLGLWILEEYEGKERTS